MEFYICILMDSSLFNIYLQLIAPASYIRQYFSPVLCILKLPEL